MSSASALYGFSEAFLATSFQRSSSVIGVTSPSARDRCTAAWTAAFEMRVCVRPVARLSAVYILKAEVAAVPCGRALMCSPLVLMPCAASIVKAWPKPSRSLPVFGSESRLQVDFGRLAAGVPQDEAGGRLADHLDDVAVIANGGAPAVDPS